MTKLLVRCLLLCDGCCVVDGDDRLCLMCVPGKKLFLKAGNNRGDGRVVIFISSESSLCWDALLSSKLPCDIF